jgi:aminoglycoside phosphotransferase (APT) family kinase protein
LRRAQWHRPDSHGQRPDAEGSRATPDPVLTSLDQALSDRGERVTALGIQRQRLAGRSNIYVIKGTSVTGSPLHLVVKQPHVGWSQDDVDNPLGAAEEYDALVRLDTHFRQIGDRFRVPRPVALLPDIHGFAMEYVPGPTIKDLLHYGSVARPKILLDGLGSAGMFLRRLHGIDHLPPTRLDLRQEADNVLAVVADKLHPLGLDLPGRVRRTLSELPSHRVTASRVWLHGDFGPANVILEDAGYTVGLDASLSTVGQPEDDLVRFVALVSGSIRLAPEIGVPPIARVRHALEERFLENYYQATIWPPLFELRLLGQLARRWLRLRELAAQHQRKALVRMKRPVISQQMQRLMKDCEHRLVLSLDR